MAKEVSKHVLFKRENFKASILIFEKRDKRRYTLSSFNDLEKHSLLFEIFTPKWESCIKISKGVY